MSQKVLLLSKRIRPRTCSGWRQQILGEDDNRKGKSKGSDSTRLPLRRRWLGRFGDERNFGLVGSVPSVW